MDTKLRHLNFPVEVKQAIDEFLTQIITKDGDEIESIRLYGSVIKGTYRKGESDVDLLIISKNKKINEDILDMETAINLKYGVVLCDILDTPEEVAEMIEMGYPFMKEVMEKGEILYDRG